MKLSAVYIKNVRSVKDAGIEDIDNFNVLIGKANSGKSNIMYGIHAFFQILSNGSLVSSNPMIGNLSEFTQRDATHPISISAQFNPSHDEIISILKQMRDERPEISTALEALPPDLSLYIRMSILSPPKAYSFIEEVALTSLSDKTRTWSLLQIGLPSAEELHRNYRDYQATQRDHESLTRLLTRVAADDWRRLRRDEPPYLYRAVLDSAGVSPDTITTLRPIVLASKSFVEFQTAIREKIGKLEDARRVISERRLTAPVKTLSGVEDQIPLYIRELLRSIVGIKILYLREQRPQIGGEEAQTLLNLKTRRGGSETLTRIQKIVAQLLGVHVDAFSANGRPRPGERYPGLYAAELGVDDFLVELNGSGIRESLRLILDATFEEPNILLVEEREIHLNAGLEMAMMRFLKEISQKCQVLITTHSTTFLESGDCQRIYLVSKDNATLIEPLALKKLEERLPIELGIRLSSLFMCDRLVFVEGPSDELIIRELCNVLTVNLSRGNVGFIVLSGIGNLSHYAARETLEFLEKRNVQMIFLIDRDERADAEIKRIKETLGPRVVFFPTEPRELENYLIIPSAIAGYISERKQNGETVSASEIGALVESKADELKGYTFLKHLCHHIRPIYPDRQTPGRGFDLGKCIEHFREVVTAMQTAAGALEKSVDSLQQQISSDLENRWTTEKCKLVPGTELLDEVFKTYGLRFVKLRDGPALAAKLDANDIDSELSAILRSLDL